MRRQALRTLTAVLLGGLMLVLARPLTAQDRRDRDRDGDDDGAVYVMTNKDTGNTIVVFHRTERGRLVRAAEVGTGGNGSGGGSDALASQGALQLAVGGHLLFAVNAGSNDLSLLAVTDRGLRLLDTVPSGGERPVSVAIRHNLVYVLNAGGTPNITGFFLTFRGRLRPIAGSTRPLAGGTAAAPAEVAFSPDGETLLVTEKGTDTIDVFPLEFGRPAAALPQPSNGPTPFGFSFGRHGVVLVSEAGASAVSSYRIDRDDMLQTISSSIPDTQIAACWVVLDRGGRFAFVTNTGSGTVSWYRVSGRGRLSLLSATAGATGAASGAIDLNLSQDGRFLYALNAANGTLTGFRVRGGTLTAIDQENGFPTSMQGIAVR